MAVRVFSLTFVLLSAVAIAQTTPNDIKIQGEILYPTGTVLSDFSVELCEPGGEQRKINTTTITNGGQFSFDRVPAAVYLVKVTSQSGKVIGEQIVKPAGMLSRVQVRLPGKSERRPVSALVSMTELSHKVSRPVLKEALQADKALKKHDIPLMIAHLEKVVEIDPEYVPARKNLSLGYLKMLQFEKAIGSFEKLAVLDVHSPLPYAGLSVAYYNLDRLADSETAAILALQIDSSYELGHYLLGNTLAAQNKDNPQALRHLAQAMRHFPAAHVTAAGILARQGQRDEARSEIQAYLDSDDTSSRSQAGDLLKALY